jgi:AcrR family transcriptional regulator
MTGRDEWIQAAIEALVHGGEPGVRVEALARDLGVTKGSFYWHFADRAALLDGVLERWEQGARAELEEAGRGASSEERIATLLRRLARPATGIPEAEIHAWARRERGVAERVWEVERARVVFLKSQLAGMGASLVDAHRLAEAGYLAAVAWLDRAARTPWMKSDYAAFVSDVFRFLLRQQQQAPMSPAPRES